MNPEKKQLKRVHGSAFILILLILVGCTQIRSDQKVIPGQGNLSAIAQGQVRIEPGYVSQQNDDFAGSTSCRSCHLSIYKRWISTSHGQSLTQDELNNPPHTGSCDRCHFVPSGERHVGCEACHGPRLMHLTAEDKRAIDDCTICKVQKQCIQCHNRSIDPDFAAQEDWKRVSHGKE